MKIADYADCLMIEKKNFKSEVITRAFKLLNEIFIFQSNFQLIFLYEPSTSGLHEVYDQCSPFNCLAMIKDCSITTNTKMGSLGFYLTLKSLAVFHSHAENSIHHVIC